jgi:hypothetical protein
MPTCVGQGKRAFADIEADKLDLELLRTHGCGPHLLSALVFKHDRRDRARRPYPQMVFAAWPRATAVRASSGVPAAP